MTFFDLQDRIQKEEYQIFLKTVGALSNLFSSSKSPFLYYRIAEKIFCRSFKADDLSRSDISVDAKKNGLGIGLKTFLAKNHKSFQKIAEFTMLDYEGLSVDDVILKIANLRNKRLVFTDNACDLHSSIYHCVVREEKKFLIYEEDMHQINLDKIRNIKRNRNVIKFNDNLNEYSFSLSKSTLSKRFNTTPVTHEFDVDVFKDPLLKLKEIFEEMSAYDLDKTEYTQTINLPLYSNRGFSKSGLNQWNAGGRKRDINEVYIPIPKKIHKYYPNFFPSRDTHFSLILPSGKILKSKVCQDGEKALMSQSNKELGKWILRDVLNLKEKEVLTYGKLEEIGIDSVRIDKLDNQNYEINFLKIGSYETFKTNKLIL